MARVHVTAVTDEYLMSIFRIQESCKMLTITLEYTELPLSEFNHMESDSEITSPQTSSTSVAHSKSLSQNLPVAQMKGH